MATNYSSSFDDPFFPQLAYAMLQTAFKEAGMQDYGGDKALELAQQLGQGASIDEINAVIAQQGLSPFSGIDDLQGRNRAIPGHNESFSPFNPVDILSGVADVGGELLDEPGFQALLAAGGAGYLMGPTTSAAVGGTAGGTGLSSAYAPTSLGGGGASSLGLGTQYAPTALGGSGASGLGLNASLATGSLAPGFFASETLGPLALGAGAGAVGGAASALGGAGSLLSGIGDLWGGIKKYLPSGNTAAALAPIIAAIAYAKNQGPFDTSRLTSTYDQFQPDALAYEFDQNTNAGRNALTSSLTNRGVMGSSFGNMDLTNFQTTRDLGRRSLVNQGLAVRGGLANNILEAQVKERQLKNQLYGTSLLALGNVFGGRNNQGAP
jgi:hypothetical protein